MPVGEGVWVVWSDCAVRSVVAGAWTDSGWSSEGCLDDLLDSASVSGLSSASSDLGSERLEAVSLGVVPSDSDPLDSDPLDSASLVVAAGWSLVGCCWPVWLVPFSPDSPDVLAGSSPDDAGTLLM